MKKVLIILGITVFVANGFAMCSKSLESKTTHITYSGHFRLPNDPLDIQTMEDYELSLALQLPWFEYDDSGRAFHGAIDTWTFDAEKGAYTFTINPKAKWSNGEPITAQDLLFNLNRVKKRGSKFFNMLDAIIEYNKLEVLNKSQLLVPTKSQNPNQEVFQRLAAQAFGLVHPSDVNKDGKVVSAKVSSGAYSVGDGNDTATTITLKLNNYYLFYKPTQADEITIRLGSPTRLHEFLSDKVEDSFITTYTLMTKQDEQRILGANLPSWTRGFDRVSSLRMNENISSQRKKQVQEILKSFSREWLGSPVHSELSSNVSVAQSLQPIGYPLNYNVSPENFSVSPKDFDVTLKGVTYDTSITDLQLQQINRVAKRLGVKIDWEVVSKQDFFAKKPFNDAAYDVVMISWGVADNDPGTWMSLILGENGPFMPVNPSVTERSKVILNSKGRSEIIEGYKALLLEMQTSGSYVPLYHFSTLTLGRVGLSFHRVGDLDETVEFAKIDINSEEN